MILSFVILFSCFILLVFYLSKNRKPKNYPPGPYSWPIFGNLLQLSPDSFNDFINLAKKYGDLFSIDLGTLRSVVINDYKLIKEIYGHTHMSARPEILQFMEPGPPKGIVATEGRAWMEQRRFVLKTLRDFGFGKKSMESLIHEEVNELIENLKNDENKPIYLNDRFNIAVFNALWTIVAGERFHHNETKVHTFIHHLASNLEDAKVLGILMCYPWFAKIMPEYSGFNACRRRNKPIYDFIEDVIKEHKKTFQMGNNRDLLDCYLENSYQTNDPSSSFYKDEADSHLAKTLFDIFLGGTETTSYTLTWTVLLLARYPDIQEKLYDEIKNVVGDSRLPSLSDKSSLPYLDAVVLEILRFSSLAPLAFRRSVEDIEYLGYVIPKGTNVIANLYGIHFDPKVWGDPENFRPERFLNENKTKIVKNEALLPFGYGRRFCIGETFARDQTFLFTASLFQRYKIKLGPNENPSKNIEVLSGGQMRMPKPQLVVLQDRFPH